MKLFVLTGGIGCGKSSVAKLLNDSGVAILDTDVLARRIVEPGMPGYHDLRQAFGDQFFDSDGCLLRQQLASYVFSDETGNHKRTLEQCTHPHIRKMLQRELIRMFFYMRQTEGIPAGCLAIKRPKSVCLVVPLYYETSMSTTGLFANLPTLCIAINDPAIQKERICSRETPAISMDEASKRMQHQMPMEEKAERSMYSILNESTCEDLEAEVRKFSTRIPKFRNKKSSYLIKIYEDGALELIANILLICFILYRQYQKLKRNRALRKEDPFVVEELLE